MADQTLAADDNLQGGITYTFTFKLKNWFTEPSIDTLLADIRNNAPSFIGSVTGSLTRWLPTIDYYNITFNYTGDGSDVVSDVAAELIAAFSTGSNDDFTFSQATSGTAGVSNVSIAQGQVQTVATSGTAAATQIAQTAGDVASTIVSKAVAPVLDTTISKLWPILLVVGLGFGAYIIATTGIGRSNA